jgi:hypothetical protein
MAWSGRRRAALGVRQRQGATVEESVVDYLRMRRLLVVLDNCEHARRDGPARRRAGGELPRRRRAGNQP